MTRHSKKDEGVMGPQKFLQHISYSHTYMYFATQLIFCGLPILKQIQIYPVWFLFGVIPVVDSYSRHSGTIDKYQMVSKIVSEMVSKMVSKIVECLLQICINTNAKFIVICKPRTLKTVGEDSVQYRKRKKHCFLAAAILLLIGKIVLTW